MLNLLFFSSLKVILPLITVMSLHVKIFGAWLHLFFLVEKESGPRHTKKQFSLLVAFFLIWPGQAFLLGPPPTCQENEGQRPSIFYVSKFGETCFSC